MEMAGRKAGQNIRNLALQRRFKALTLFASATFLIILPFALNQVFTDLLKQLSLGSSSAQTPILPPILYIGCIVASVGCLVNGLYWWKRANHADQGAKGEEDV